MEIGWVNTPQDWRDVFIMTFMVAGTLLFIFGTIFTIITGLLTIGVVSRLRRILKDNLQPAVENVRETSASVRTTVTFISDHAVMPVVRAYGAYAGARRFIVVFMRFARPRR